jgi:hypothetical protein
MPMTRDSWPARSRPVSGATASQPTNESIRVAAARPMDSQPCGANGVQLAGLAACTEPVTAVTTTAISSATSSNWARADARTPPSASPSTTSSNPAAMAARASGPPPVSAVT